MGINLNWNYSTLFSSLSTQRSTSTTSSMSGMYSMLTDYSSIKAGGYGKLLKAYYANQSSSSSESSSTSSKTETLSTTTDKKLTLVKGSTDGLKESAAKLTETGEKSLFTEEQTAVTDEMYKAVTSFVSDYNDVMENASASSNSNVSRNASYLAQLSSVCSKSLSQVGITINTDNTLSVDEETFKAADVDKVATLFNGENSYADMVSQRADFIGDAAVKAATSSGVLYGSDGTYSALQTASSYEWLL